MLGEILPLGRAVELTHRRNRPARDDGVPVIYLAMPPRAMLSLPAAAPPI